MIYGSFCLSLFSRSSRDLCPKTFYFQFPLFFETVCICDMVLMCSNITEPPTCYDLINHFLHAIVEQLPLREWLKEKGWSKESLALNWSVWEQRLMCGLLVSSKDHVSHSVQARADRNPFFETHSKCPFAALN